MPGVEEFMRDSGLYLRPCIRASGIMVCVLDMRIMIVRGAFVGEVGGSASCCGLREGRRRQGRHGRRVPKSNLSGLPWGSHRNST